MNSQDTADDALRSGPEDMPEIEFTDDDILDAMRRIPGYLDISTQDFRAIYHLAHAHAVDRLFRQVEARSLMQRNLRPLRPETRLDDAARQLVAQGAQEHPGGGRNRPCDRHAQPAPLSFSRTSA